VPSSDTHIRHTHEITLDVWPWITHNVWLLCVISSVICISCILGVVPIWTLMYAGGELALTHILGIHKGCMDSNYTRFNDNVWFQVWYGYILNYNNIKGGGYVNIDVCKGWGLALTHILGQQMKSHLMCSLESHLTLIAMCDLKCDMWISRIIGVGNIWRLMYTGGGGSYDTQHLMCGLESHMTIHHVWF
jgi:hypothetical protein